MKIEFIVASAFLSSTEKNFQEDIISYGRPEKKEPDIIYNDWLIEIGAILREKSKSASLINNKNLKIINSKIGNQIPSQYTIEICYKEHTQKSSINQMNTKYPNLSKGVDFVCLYKSETTLKGKPGKINFGMCPETYEVSWFPEKAKQQVFFCKELYSVFLLLSESSFNELNKETSFASISLDDYKESPSSTIKISDELISKKVLDKLTSNKYIGSPKEKILLLHNYEYQNELEFTDTQHYYSHNREKILKHIKSIIDQYKSYDYYSQIYFVDFSLYFSAKQSEIYDFSTITGKKYQDTDLKEMRFKFN